MECGLLLNVVVGQGATIFQLLASEDQPLLIWGNAFLVLDFRLDILNGVTWLNLKGDGLASQGLHKDLHATPESQDQMECGLLLNVVVRQGATIFQLLAGEDQPLLIWGNAFLVLDFRLDILNGVTWLNLKGDGLASQSLHKDLHATPESQDQMECGLLLNVVVRQGATIFQLLASKDQPLLIWGNAFLVLDFGLDILNGVTWLNLKSDGLASQGLHKDLHATPETQHQVKRGLLLNVVVGQGATIFQLLASKDQPLLIWGNAFLVLDFGLDILNGVTWLNFKSDGLASQGLHKDLHATPETQH
ncbi:hypothetical protein C0J50_0283 [Silurus asotus]|uniref:Ubiquitin/40s ribosomal protein s27a fusion n=1 Tax=Silurus asotus TaxID=30991 RepID=A0AAD5AGD7_SILAS|nr:hypothetical protein C0J50_0283 [Silurus asotus]